MNATGQRWINELANFNFSIYYKPGVQNVIPDALSQFPIEKNTVETNTVKHVAVWK